MSIKNVDTQFTNSTNTTMTPFPSAPDWALDFQAKIRDLDHKLGKYDSRLANVESLALENAKLRAELDLVKAELTAAQHLLKTHVTMPIAPTTKSPPPNVAPTTVTAICSPPAASTTAFTTVVNKRKRKAKKPAPPSPATLAAFSRTMSPKSDSPSLGYRFIYYKAIKKPLSWYRQELLPIVNISNSRVLDIHFPVHRVVSFLVHSDFVLEFTCAFNKKLKIDPLLDFDPLEDQNLLDPAFSSFDSVSRSRKIQDLQNMRVLRAITFVRPSVRLSVAKSMLLQNFIGQAQFDAILADTLAARAAQIPATTSSASERKERKRIRVEYYFNLNYLDPICAMALATSPPLSVLPDPTGDAHVNDPLPIDMQE